MGSETFYLIYTVENIYPFPRAYFAKLGPTRKIGGFYVNLHGKICEIFIFINAKNWITFCILSQITWFWFMGLVLVNIKLKQKNLGQKSEEKNQKIGFFCFNFIYKLSPKSGYLGQKNLNL